MLAQNFKSAADLEITEPQKEALMKTLVLLETGKLEHVKNYERRGLGSNEFTSHFNMMSWGTKTECGTVHCIGGTAEAITGDRTLFDNWSVDAPHGLRWLFAPDQDYIGRRWHNITTAQAATALRSYLTTGDARWDLAVAS